MLALSRSAKFIKNREISSRPYDIKGEDKAALLVELYNGALYAGQPKMFYKCHRLSEEPGAYAPDQKEFIDACEFDSRPIAYARKLACAQKLITATPSLVFVEIDLGDGPRVLDVNIFGDQLDAYNYDMLHGNGHASELIYNLTIARLTEKNKKGGESATAEKTRLGVE